MTMQTHHCFQGTHYAGNLITGTGKPLPADPRPSSHEPRFLESHLISHVQFPVFTLKKHPTSLKGGHQCPLDYLKSLNFKT